VRDFTEQLLAGRGWLNRPKKPHVWHELTQPFELRYCVQPVTQASSSMSHS